MPELFGNAYVLPAVIVVVLLLVLLLVLMMRKRRGTSPGRVHSEERVVTPPARPMSNEATEAPAAAFVPATQATAATTQPAASSEAPAAIAPATNTGGSSERAALIDDPLQAVIIDIVHGWGDLTTEDTNRLALFRPEKILAAAQAIELPKEDAAGGYARTRLLEIRKYAADRQLQHKTPDSTPTAGLEPVVETEAAQTEVAHAEAIQAEVARAEVSEVKPEGPTPLWGSPQPEGMMAGAGLAAAAVAVAGQGEQIEDRQSLERALGDDVSEWSAPTEAVVASPWSEEPQPTDTVVASPWSEEPQPAEPAVSSPWPEEPTGWDTLEPPALEEVPARPDEETLLIAAEATGFGEAEDLAPIGDMTARAQAPEDSLSSLHLRVRTAEELMALPPGDRADMLAFLEPPELARVIETTDDRRLKKAVIDVLENLGNPASLDVLRRCLDDPDQEIQLYALDAADRLLGVE